MARRDGWVTPTLAIKGKKKDIINACLDPQPFYDDWTESRDGMRGYNDKKSIMNKNMWSAESYEVERYNEKNKRLLMRRKLRKEKQKHKLAL